MSDFGARQSFFRANRYQRPIMGMALMPTFVFCTLLSIFVLFLHNELISYLRFNSSIESIGMINRWGWFVVIMIWTFFVVTYIWAQMVSSRMVGAFERVNRELDQVVAGEDVDSIKARENDHLVNDILKRVNALIRQKRSLMPANPSGQPAGNV